MMVREKSRECHNHKPQPIPDTKRTFMSSEHIRIQLHVVHCDIAHVQSLIRVCSIRPVYIDFIELKVKVHIHLKTLPLFYERRQFMHPFQK